MKHILCILVLCAGAFAQGFPVNGEALKSSAGQGGVQVRVCTKTATGTPCFPLASIYSDEALTLPKANPFNADTEGNYSYYAAAGIYKEQVGQGAQAKTRITSTGGSANDSTLLHKSGDETATGTKTFDKVNANSVAVGTTVTADANGLKLFNTQLDTGSSLNRPFVGLMAALAAGQSTSLQVISNSTGTDFNGVNTRWPYLLSQWFAAQYPNYTVRLRDWNDTNQTYDVPVYVQDKGERYANFTGVSQMEMDNAQVPTLTGDVDLRVKIQPGSWRPAAHQALLSHWGTAGNRSFSMWLTTGGNIFLQWTVDGSTTKFAQSTAAIDAATTGALWLRAVHDVDNGAAGNTVTFYTSVNGSTWTPLGTAVTAAGTTSYFNSTANWQIGAMAGSVPYTGKIYAAEIWQNGTIVNPQGIENFRVYNASESFGGSPTLDILNASKSGADLAYWSNATRSPKALQPWAQPAVIFALIHNDAYNVGATYLGNVGTYLNSIKTALPTARIVLTTENPRIPGTTYDSYMAERRKEFMAWGPMNGYLVLDTAQAFYLTPNWKTAGVVINVDGVHPTVAGFALILNDMEKALNASR